MNIMAILDIFTSVTTVVTLLLVAKYPNAWLVYSVGNIAFVVVCVDKHLIGLTCMGIILFFVGLNNFRLARKK